MLKKSKVICLYFSGGWCPPCRSFTPILVEFYKQINQGTKQVIEIIYCSRDRNEQEFRMSLLEQRLWLSYKFNDEKIEKLIDEYGIKCVPTLLVLNHTGKVITKKGRTDVQTEFVEAF